MQLIYHSLDLESVTKGCSECEVVSFMSSHRLLITLPNHAVNPSLLGQLISSALSFQLASNQSLTMPMRPS